MNFTTATLLQLRDNIVGGSLKRRASKPYMKYREMIILEEIFKNFQPATVLEWGAGYSTLYFPQMIQDLNQWLSIENSSEWVDKVTTKNHNRAVEVRYIPENTNPWTDEHNDGSYDDLRNYVDYPSEKAPFDCILIDGRARSACLRKAFEIIKDEGIVIVHDANREYYLEHANVFKEKILLQDYRRTAGGLLIVSKRQCINAVIDVNKHQRNWGRINNVIGKVLSI
ncbi:MAG: class I SAM-dependent methyltransferase [Cyclobacteriaceae bacterium]|nr:class I SAM-dependent methyltransferase [Cyclobacteriaceae bacterium HetDA_MAG_MS6]